MLKTHFKIVMGGRGDKAGGGKKFSLPFLPFFRTMGAVMKNEGTVGADKALYSRL